MMVRTVTLLATPFFLASAAAPQTALGHKEIAARIGIPTRLTMATRTFFAFAQQGGATVSAPPPTPEEPRPLGPSKPIERDLAGGQTHAYVVQVAAGQYLHIVVDQRGIDVVVSLFSPDGPLLAEIDSPSGTTGIEPVFWVAQSEGIYRVEVRGLDKNAHAGKYQIRMDALRPAKNEDQGRIQAQKNYMEGRALARKPSEGPLRMAKIQFQDSLRTWLALKDQERAQQTFIYLNAVYQALANLLAQKRDFDDAKSLTREYHSLAEMSFGKDSFNVVYPVRIMAYLLESQGQFESAESMRKQELGIVQKTKGPNSVETAMSLAHMAQLKAREAKYAEAEALYQQAQALFEKAEGPLHKDVGALLLQRGDLYSVQTHYAEAEQAYKRSLDIYEKSAGAEDTAVSPVLIRLAKDYSAQDRFAEAMALEQRALGISEKTFGPTHPEVARNLIDMAQILVLQKKYDDARPLYQRALSIVEKAEGRAGPDTFQIKLALIGLYSLQANQAAADPLIQDFQNLIQRAPDALKAIRNAAAQKESWAPQFLLGVLYEKGRGVKQDYAEALKWYSMAAVHGDPQACQNQGNIYENGLGVPQDNVEAFKWYSLAGPGHADWDAHKKTLAAHLTREQLDEAQKRATDWQKLHPPKP